MYNEDNNANHELELYILCAFIMSNDKFFEYDIEARDFGFDATAAIFQFISSRLNYGLSIDLNNVKTFLAEKYKEINSNDYIKEILTVGNQSLTKALTLQKAIKSLQDLSDKRKLRGLVAEQHKNIADGSKNAQEIKESILEGLDEIKDFKHGSKTVDIKQSLISTFEKKDVETVYTGFKRLDEVTTGFEEGSFVVLAAGTGMGKSALAANILFNVAEQEKSVALFSLEMNHEQITRRIAASVASINLTKLKYDNLTSQYEQEAFTKAVDKISKLPIKINDDGFLTLVKLRHEIKTFVKKNNTKLVIIDYIQLIKHDCRGNEVQKITEITNYLKALAMEFKIVIVGLSQLSRGVSARDNKRPTLADLRSSGSIEQDANCVIFVFRPEYYLNNEKPSDINSSSFREWQESMQKLKGVAYVNVAKNRDGGLGEVKFRFDGEFVRFIEDNNNNRI